MKTNRRKTTTGYNKQFGKSTAEVLNSTFGILFDFSAKLNISFPKPCLRQAAGRYPNLRFPNLNLFLK